MQLQCSPIAEDCDGTLKTFIAELNHTYHFDSFGRFEFVTGKAVLKELTGNVAFLKNFRCVHRRMFPVIDKILY